ncbi:MAG: hypothetical protein QNJ37_17800 [Crocosphaera sp.]|nr:hypothetical protein [Crocosphaera sp.]
MKNQLIKEKSDISRTNQLKILPNQDIAEKLYQYLFKAGKGIESFELKYPPATDEENHDSDNSTSKGESADYDSQADFYRKRHEYIKKEVKNRLSQYGEEINYSDIQYFLSYKNGKNNIFFLSPNKQNSSWKRLFEDNRERIFNLVFKFYLLSLVLPGETIKGFEELFFLHSKNLTKSKDTLLVWGQNLLVRYNHHNVLTLTLTRKSRRFLSQDRKDYNTVDAENLDLEEIIVHKNKNYYFSRDRDARRSNSIYFMNFSKDKEGKKYEKFKKTQLYYYQNLMNKLEDFLKECDIKFEILDFQANHYLDNPFIKNIEAVESLKIINNIGINLTEIERQFLQQFFKHKGVSVLTFYNSGKTISTYEKVENEEDPCWRITEVIPWSSIELDKKKNYLIFNKILEEEVGSMAYQRDDGLWCPSTKLDKRSQVDFYSQLKKKYNYLDTGEFYSIQGVNIPEFQILQEAKQGRQKEGEDKNLSILSYPSNIYKDNLAEDCLAFSDGEYLEIEDYLTCYLIRQEDSEAWEKFCKIYKLKIAPEFEKIIIELGIKSWIKQSISNADYALPINSQSFAQKEFWVIYVRSPKKKEPQAVAVQFLYKEGYIYLKYIMRNINEIKRRFRFLRRQKNNSEKLINDQQYFVDESEKLYISCYTSDNFTPTLIGRHNIVKELENNTLEVNRARKGENSSKLLPVVSYYNSNLKTLDAIQNLICFDLEDELFIQYFVPPAKNIGRIIKKGFRVYHLIGKKYSGESIYTSQLIEHPMAALHFSTLTQNILKINDNSQSSLLQKIAKVLVEN